MINMNIPKNGKRQQIFVFLTLMLIITHSLSEIAKTAIDSDCRQHSFVMPTQSPGMR